MRISTFFMLPLAVAVSAQVSLPFRPPCHAMPPTAQPTNLDLFWGGLARRATSRTRLTRSGRRRPWPRRSDGFPPTQSQRLGVGNGSCSCSSNQDEGRRRGRGHGGEWGQQDDGSGRCGGPSYGGRCGSCGQWHHGYHQRSEPAQGGCCWRFVDCGGGIGGVCVI
ncbi:hypothetical protein BD289DRAFT_34989 [Coniella lustricola]|uniref:Uncharacterized protein n=1 Tax=Coniella lustricola TaxID=2025994 RepID=A0A2T3A2D5_9PEZI|nr:hypothetical protein BD289DRAFT_34989 [Coniella lustricola]